MAQHDKIINAAAKEILAPEGLFRIGQSRRWADDNGWFVIQVEFQPSGYSKGSYLNVGVHFLWSRATVEDEVSSFDYGHRVEGFVGYRGNDENFAKHMNRFANTALEKVKEYRQFQEYACASTCLSTQNQKIFRNYYDIAMLNFLHGKLEDGKAALAECMDELQGLNYDYSIAFYKVIRDEILPRCTSAEDAQHMVLEMIQRRRALICARASYKKMKKEFIFQGQEY